eukprot:GFUD01031126.1.p1 GENE.GFUD01031126.1~~GFUD01031126.1.p1  ORF type:complete len:521 (+),score=127.53 GFUD01031126.1:84-1646(+)
MFSLSTTKLEDNAAHCELVLTDFWSKLTKLCSGTHIGSHKFEVGQSEFQLVVYPSGRGEMGVLSVFLVNCNTWDVSLSSKIDLVDMDGMELETKATKLEINIIEKMSDCHFMDVDMMEVDKIKISLELKISPVAHGDIPINFGKKDSLEKIKFTSQSKGLESASSSVKDMELDSKLDTIHSNVSQITNWMCSIKDSIDKLSTEVVKIKSETSGKVSKSKECLTSGEECSTSRHFESLSDRDMCSLISSEIASLRENIEANRYDQRKDLEMLRDDVQANTDGLRKVYRKIDDADKHTVEMKSHLDEFEAKLFELPYEVESSKKKVIARLEKLQSDLATSNDRLLVEVKDKVTKNYDLDRALRKDLEANRNDQRKDLEMLRDDVQEITGLFSKLSENVRDKQKENSYNSIEGFKWIWGKVDQDSQSLSKLFEEQVEAQTLVLLDTVNQKSAKTLAAPECPYCMEELRPPGRIFQCFTGHLICQKCLANPSIRECPTCSQKIIGRNRGLENFLENAAVFANWN